MRSQRAQPTFTTAKLTSAIFAHFFEHSATAACNRAAYNSHLVVVFLFSGHRGDDDHFATSCGANATIKGVNKAKIIV